MKREIKKHRRSRQDEAIALYKKGFSQNEIAQILGINQSTVSRYFNNPTKHEVEDFYQNYAYGAYHRKNGSKVYFNRRYQPLENNDWHVPDVVHQEWYYNDGTYWPERFYNSINKVVVYGYGATYEQNNPKRYC